MNKIRIYTLILAIFVLFTGKVYSNTPETEVKLTPSSFVKQGHTCFVTIKTENKLVNPYITFNSKKYNLFSSGNNEYRTILGIEAIEKIGKKELSIKDESGKLDIKENINIVASNFPIQNLKLSKSTVGLTATEDEIQKIEKLKKTVSYASYWDKYPFKSPTNGCIASIYGLSRYYNGKFSGNYHKGIDIKAPHGREIRTIAPGKVLIAEQFRLNGGTVGIDHGQGLTSIYLHMSKITAKVGETVKQDQKIGEVGSTGFATGPHLHWGLYIYGIPVDPMSQWIQAVPKC